MPGFARAADGLSLGAARAGLDPGHDGAGHQPGLAAADSRHEDRIRAWHGAVRRALAGSGAEAPTSEEHTVSTERSFTAGMWVFGSARSRPAAPRPRRPSKTSCPAGPATDEPPGPV